MYKHRSRFGAEWSLSEWDPDDYPVNAKPAMTDILTHTTLHSNMSSYMYTWHKCHHNDCFIVTAGLKIIEMTAPGTPIVNKAVSLTTFWVSHPDGLS